MVEIITRAHSCMYTARCFQGRVSIYALEFLFTGSSFYISGPVHTSPAQSFTIRVNNNTLPTYDRKHPFTPFRWIKLRHEDKLTVRYCNATAVVLMGLEFDCVWGKSAKARRAGGGLTHKKMQQRKGGSWRTRRRREIQGWQARGQREAPYDLGAWLDQVPIPSIVGSLPPTQV